MHGTLGLRGWQESMCILYNKSYFGETSVKIFVWVKKHPIHYSLWLFRAGLTDVQSTNFLTSNQYCFSVNINSHCSQDNCLNELFINCSVYEKAICFYHSFVIYASLIVALILLFSAISRVFVYVRVIIIIL